MANVFADLPLPAFNGPGASVDTSGFGSPKTLTCVGSFDQTTIAIEISVDGGTEWAPIAVFQASGPEVQVVEFAASHMRTNVSGRKTTVPFAADVDVAAPAGNPQFTALALPAGNGAGVAVDISTFDPLLTVISGGDFSGASIQVQISEDNVEFGALAAFVGQGGSFNRIATANWIRAFVSGRKDTVAFSGTLALGAVSAGGAAGGIDIEQGGAPIVNNPHDTLNFTGAGVNVTDVAGVATVDIAGGEFIPARTLFVAQSWPAGADPLVFFTTIPPALAQALTLTPTATNPVEILVYPGTYSAAIDLVSNVHLVGAGQFRSAIISGAVTWTPGTGVNAPQQGTTEQLNTAFLNFASTIAINSLTKTGTCILTSRGNVTTGITWTGRPTGGHSLIHYASAMVNGTYTYTDITVLTLATRVNTPVTFAGTTTFKTTGCEIFGGTTTLSGTASGVVTGSSILTATAVPVGCAIKFAGCDIVGALSGAGAFDVRGSNYNRTTLAGITGTCQRTTQTITGIVAVGAIVFAVPYLDANYNVHLQLTAGVGNAGATVTGKTPTQFTLTDVIGGNTWDATVIHD